MARIRAIKIGFFQNEYLAELPAHDRLLFAGLWVLADREGRLEDRPSRIRAELFPYESIDVNASLDRLKSAGFIIRYEANEQHYLQVVAFQRHQRPHPKEPQSLIQPPVRQKPCNFTASRGKDMSSRMGSGILDLGNGNGIDQTPPARSRSLPKAPNGFEAFWALYPKRKGKGAAQKAWTKHDPPLEAVRNALAWQITQPDWTKDAGQFIPHPATWLNQRRWEDEPFHLAPKAVPSMARTFAWRDECQSLHGGRCGSHEFHAAVMAKDAE